MSNELCFTPAVTLAKAIRQRQLSPVELMQAVLTQIERVNPSVNAFITLLSEQALDAARQAEKTLMHSSPADLSPLFGLPITVKDLTETAGVRTTFGSPAFFDNVPERDGTAWSRLKAAGAILVGKTSTPPFGWLGFTDNELVGLTNNPWDTSLISGGSSGGAATAIACGMAPLATGSDGGGSIRIPASCCGVVGLKPSHGRIPRNFEADGFETTGAVGPLTRTVADAALMLSIMAGPDEREPYMLPEAGVDYVSLIEQPPKNGWRIAYCADLGNATIAREVRDIVGNAVQGFARDLGASVDEVKADIPDPVDYFLAYWPAAVALLYDDYKETLQQMMAKYPSMQMLVPSGRSMSATELWKTATTTRGKTHAGIAAIFSQYDFLITPTMPLAPFPHPGPEAGPTHIDGKPVQVPCIDFHRLTEPFSHTGHPAITVPCGFNQAGVPIGMQIVGRHRADAQVLSAAAAFEQIAPWAHLRPPVAR